jgi:threonyl-tRNA synthetase
VDAGPFCISPSPEEEPLTTEAQEVDQMDIAVDTDDSRAYELARMRHSTAHLMAEAVQEMFPDAKFGIGPAIENGFYYDFDLPRPLTPADLEQIEQRMRAHRNKDERFERKEISKEEALEIFGDNPYKVELIEGFPPGETISTYQQGDFLDLCRGPHVESTKQIGPFKLQSVAGAYWRGDEKRPMLQRIYGTAWNTKEELADYLTMLEEAQKRDHRKLGRELDLFSVSEEIGPGLILWHPKGGMIRYLVEQFEQQEQLKRGYDLVYTPHIASEKIYRTSGHLETYGENMYSPMSIEEVDYYLKPMNCPGHIMISRIADPDGGTRHRLPVRALGHIARHAPGPRFHTG